LALEWSHYEGDDCLRLTGWSRRDVARLRVYPADLVDAARRSNLQPLDGRFHVEDAAAYFVPRYPFVPGMAYTVTASDVDEIEPVSIMRPTEPAVPVTHVVEIYPTAPELPRNHLRFYVHFSNPMSEGLVESCVRIVASDTGETLPAVFLPMEPELWDPQRRRATVLLDPARIKRGLAPHDDLGYPLAPGAAIDLVVDARFLDADGRPLIASGARHYMVGHDVRALVDPRAWRVRAPASNSKETLVVEFDRPLDHALLQHCLTVVDDDGAAVAGRGATALGEGEWAFTPDVPWRPRPHAIAVDPMLEDLAGNSVARVFDRELERADHTPRAGGPVVLDFRPA